MRKIISSKLPLIILCCFLCVWSLLLSIFALVFEIDGSVEDKGAGLLWFVVLGSVFCFSLWCLNRFACVVWLEDGIIKRKGLFGGFYKECPVASIQKVVIRYAWREGDHIYLVDDSTHRFDGIRKDSYISFPKTKKNLEFVHTFWSGTVEKADFNNEKF